MRVGTEALPLTQTNRQGYFTCTTPAEVKLLCRQNVS